MFKFPHADDDPYLRHHCCWLLRSILFGLLFFGQIAGSFLFLRWLLTDAWNHNSFWTSFFFAWAEVIALVSTPLGLFSALFPHTMRSPAIEVSFFTDQLRNETDMDLATKHLLSSDADTDPTNFKHDLSCAVSQDELSIILESEKSDTNSSTGPGMETKKGSSISPVISSSSFATVAVCVCRYKEPLAELFQTVKSMNGIESSSNDTRAIQLYILDDGWHSSTDEQKRSQLDGLYRVLGIKGNVADIVDDGEQLLLPIFSSTQSINRSDCASACTFLQLQDKCTANGLKPCTLIARQKPVIGNCHYKAGNLNNFLYNFLGEMAATNQEVPSHVLFLDHDMMPHPDIIEDALLSLENDPTLAFVQYPQRFHDLRGGDLLHAGNEVFFDGVQINRGRVGLAAFAGTNAVWNIQALFHVGGLGYNTLTEDTSTGYDVHRLGYRSIYSTKEMVVGRSPQTVKVAMQQRMRWSQGAVEIIMNSVASCFKKPVVPPDKWMSSELASKFSCDVPTKPTFLRLLVVFIVYLDTMIYPFYSFGFLLHVAVCVLYLATSEAPIAAKDPKAILIYWLPLYGVKYCCQLLAFPSVSLAAQWTSQMAWAGYSVSTVVSVLKALWVRFSRSRSDWFNTGAKIQGMFLLQYGNSLIALLIYLMIVYRGFAFVFVQKTCNAWISIGSIMYGFVLLLHIQGWAFEPINDFVRSNQRQRHIVLRLARNVDTDVAPADNDSSTKSLPALSMSNAFSMAHRHREQHHSLNFSILFVVTHVALFTSILFFWAENSCDLISSEPEEILIDYASPETFTPPLTATAYYNIEFVAEDGKLLLGVQDQGYKEFKIKGANWFGFETERNAPFGLYEATQDSVMHMLVENGFNALRLPLAGGSILSPLDYLVSNKGTISGSLNPHLNITSYLDLVESFVNRTASWGVFTLLDMHRLRSDKENAPFPFDEETSFEDVKAAWTILAERFCKSWSVMGADLMNEPHGVTWGDGSTIDWRILAQELAETILSICPKWLIFIEGQWVLDNAISPVNQTDFGPWGGALTAVKEFPVEISNMSKLVYSPHVYGPASIGESVVWAHNEAYDEAQLLCQCAIRSKVIDDLCTRSAQNGEHLNVTILRLEADHYCTSVLPLPHQPFPKNMANVWDLAFGFLSDLNYTIVLGEWGGTYVNPPSKNYGKNDYDPDATREREVLWNHELVAYLGRKGFSSFYWSVNPESYDTGGILLSDWRTIDPAKQWLFENLESSNPLYFLGDLISGDALDLCLDKVGAEQLIDKVGGERYKMESLAYNRALDSDRKRPRSIIFPKNEEQVQQIVLCAKEAKARVCTRSGGYSYTGDSTCNGVLVDLRHLLQLEAVDEEHFRVGPGFSLGALAKKLADLGRLVPTGTHGGIGMGWFLGCGHGFLTRLYGLGCDNIISARVVTGEGELIEVMDGLGLESMGAAAEQSNASTTEASDDINGTIESHSELMWALRGIGSNQLGIVTSIQIQTFPLPTEIRYFRFVWPREMTGRALAIWQDWGLNHPNHALSVRLTLWNPSEVPDDFAEWNDGVYLDGVFIGGEEELNEFLVPPIDALGEPSVKERFNMTYTQLLAHLMGIPNDDDLQLQVPFVGNSGSRRWFRNLGHLVKAPILQDDINEIVGFVSMVLPRAKPYEGFLALYPAGGVSTAPQRPTAFGHRDTLSFAQYGGYWDNEPSREESVVRHQLDFRNAATKFWGSGAFYNYKDKDLVDWEESYWGEENVPRLRRLKCRYDPLALFSTARQSIMCSRNDVADAGGGGGGGDNDDEKRVKAVECGKG